MAKPKFWLGLSTAGVVLTGVLLAANGLVNTYQGLVIQALNLNTTKVSSVDSAEVEGSAYAENGKLTEEGFYEMIADSYKFCERLVEQGSVLLKNDVKDGVPTLPLAKTERNISLLGQGSKNLFMRSGAGGAEPNTELVVSLDKAFEKEGFDINRTVFDKYSSLSQKQMTTPSTNVEHSFSGFYTQAMQDSFAEHGDAAVITFVRIGTENTDPGSGQLDLKNDEKSLLQMVKQHKDAGDFKKVIVLINSPMPMSVDWVNNEDYGIDACVFIGSPGYYGAGGAVHVLMGEDSEGNPINPSGHCPDTFAASASSSPAYVNFGQQSIAVYSENIYVGYKYYESRYYDSVLDQGNANGSAGTFVSSGNWDYAQEMGYPFGFGLSYTTFEQKIKEVKYNAANDVYNVKVEVTNTGEIAGKSSIQVYVNAPYTDFDKDTGLEKSAIALMAYDKVDVDAGQTVEVTIPVEKYFLCTYDYIDNRSYILEGGDYYFALGNGAHEAVNNVLGKYCAENGINANLVDHNGEEYTYNANAVAKVHINEEMEKYKTSHYSDEEVTNQFDDADYNYMCDKNNKASQKITYLTRQDWQGTWPKKISNNPASNNDSNMSQYYKKTSDTPSYKDGKGTEYDVQYYENGEKSQIDFTEMRDVPLEGKVTTGRFAGKEGADIWDAFIKQMDLDDLVISVTDNRGILDVARVNKMGNYVAEGPEGLLAKFKYGKEVRAATGFPTGPVYTGTFDHKMQQKYGGFFGEEALYCGVACVNAPGANINRTPYGSRASEYMSEDGILNYYTASNVVSEARKKGLIMNIKHCFLNNQETGRQKIHTYCNEQAIREIYLRPFEGALTRGHGLGIMTSYNRIGAKYAACHEPLMMNVMRKEWAYKGLIIDDALPGGNTDSYSNGPAMLYCGTDLFCLDGNRGGDLKNWVTTNDDGTILACLQRANKYVMYSLSRSWMGGVDAQLGSAAWLKPTVIGVTVGAGVLTLAAFGMFAFTQVVAILASKKAKKEETAE